MVREPSSGAADRLLGEGIEILRRRGACGADGGETPSLKEAFLDCFAEYFLLAAMRGRLDQDQRKAEEEVLRLRVELVRDGKTGDPMPPRLHRNWWFPPRRQGFGFVRTFVIGSAL